MVNYSSEKNRRDLGIVWVIAGAIFIFSGFSGGIGLLLLGFIWMITSNQQGVKLFQDKPDNMRTILQWVTVGLLVLTSAILIINAIP